MIINICVVLDSRVGWPASTDADPARRNDPAVPALRPAV